MHPRRALSRTLAAFASLAAVLTLSARAPAGDALALVEPLRLEASAVIAVGDAGALRRAPAGRAIAAMLHDAGLLERTAGAWAELARAIEMEPDAALEGLLGRRAALVVQPAPQDAPRRAVFPQGRPADAARWLLLSEIGPDEAARLRRGLRPAPRGVLAGRPIYALEQGRYELALDRLEGGRWLLLLAPGGRGGMLESALGAPAQAAAGASAGELVAQLRELGQGDVHAAFRLGEASVAVAGSIRGHELVMLARSSPGLLWAPRDCCVGYRLWPAQAAASVPEDAILAAFGVRDRLNPELRVPGFLPGLPGVFGRDLPAFLEAFKGRIALILAEAPPTAEHAESPKPRPITIELLAELDDVGQDAVAGDRAMAGVVALARGLAMLQPPGAHIDGAPDFEGRFPAALRSAPIGAGAVRFGRDPVVSWHYLDNPAQAPRLEAVRPGWWAARLGASSPEGGAPEPRVSELGPKSALVGPGVLVSFGHARPDRLAATLREMGFTDLGGVVPAMAWIDRLSWVAQPAGEARIASQVRIRFKDDKLQD